MEPTPFDRLDAHECLLNFANILQILSEAAYIGILTLNNGSAVKKLSMGLVRKNDEDFFRNAAEMLALIKHSTSFDNILTACSCPLIHFLLIVLHY